MHSDFHVINKHVKLFEFFSKICSTVSKNIHDHISKFYQTNSYQFRYKLVSVVTHQKQHKFYQFWHTMITVHHPVEKLPKVKNPWYKGCHLWHTSSIRIAPTDQHTHFESVYIETKFKQIKYFSKIKRTYKVHSNIY